VLLAQSDPQALQRMVATERAFAAATAEIGVRDAFLTFFADDAIQLMAGGDGTKATLGRAKDGLEKLAAPKLPILTRLMWEPFTGHVSSDGALGWLTGGYVGLSQPTNDITGQGAYFSVWKRQPNGTWRVWLDEGIVLPDVWRDASPFRVAADPDAGGEGVAAETLDAVERTVASGGDPWRARLSASVRLHRDGRMPILSRDGAAEWAAATWQQVRYSVIKTEVAGSGDLGIALGGYDASPSRASQPPGSPAVREHGTWVRVWKRDVTDRWRIVFETSKSTRN
jgi:ketosteroid isomerase-like protein